jgi:hypothetical protein
VENTKLSNNLFTVPEQQINISHEPDVLVVGGGPAGIAAAIAAARNGAETLLIEQRGYLGGMGTAALVPAFCPYTDGEKAIIRGIGMDLLERMKSAAGKVFQNRYEKQLDWVPIDVEVLKRVYDEETLSSGVQLLFHTFAGQVLTSGNEIEGVVITNKTGRSVIKAKTYIDTTGDADLAALSGVPFQVGGDEGELQPATMCYLLAGAKQEEFQEYIRDSGDTDQIPNAVQRAQEEGDLPPGRKEVSGFAWISSSIVGVNFGHIFNINGTSAEDLSLGAIKGRKLVEQQVLFLRKYVPGFKDVHLVHSGDQIGIRETRRIVGDYILTADDFLKARSFVDNIARNAYFIDIHLANSEGKMTIKHLPKGQSHGVPYRCLLPKGINNLIVAGRSVSSDRVVQGSLRVMPNCFAMGQAAGTAAAMASSRGVGFRGIDVASLQKSLIDQGAWLGVQ